MTRIGFWISPRQDGRRGYILWRMTQRADEQEGLAEPFATARFRWLLRLRYPAQVALASVLNETNDA